MKIITQVEKRHRHPIYLTDAEWQKIDDYAKSQGHLTSAFIRHAALSEISKHPRKKALKQGQNEEDILPDEF